MGRFYPNWNLTSILLLYTCLFKYEFNTIFSEDTKQTIFQRCKRAITQKIIGGFYPKSNLAYIL